MMISLTKKYRTKGNTEVVLHEIFDNRVFGRIKYGEEWRPCSWDVNDGKAGSPAYQYDLVEIFSYDDFKIDDKVLVWYDGCEEKFKRYFAGVSKDGKPMTFYCGSTSWSANEGVVGSWDYCEKAD